MFRFECAGNVQSWSHYSILWNCWSWKGEWCASIQQMYWFATVVRGLPVQYFIGGDNANPLLQRVLVPFSRGEMHNKTNRTYNFYLLQLWIHIEMAFGLLMQKWLVVADTMKYSNKINAQLIAVCIKLHNFCIQMKQKDNVIDDRWQQNTAICRMENKVGSKRFSRRRKLFSFGYGCWSRWYGQRQQHYLPSKWTF